MGNEQSSRAVPETGVVEEWRKAMEGVTPEGWTVRVGQDGSLRLCIAGEPENGPVSLRNAQWVARCTVSAVLPLLDALSAKDRELAEARAEIERLRGERDAHAACAENNARVGMADDARARAVSTALVHAERERDEAMAALREKEERVKALEEALGPFARADRALGDTSGSDRTFRLETDTGYREISRNDFRRARSVLSSVQPVSGSREQRGNEEG